MIYNCILFFDSYFIVWFWMCIWILCRCWEWACGSCEMQRVAGRVIEVIAIYFGFWNLFWNGGWQQIRGVENCNFEICLCTPSLGMMACEFSCRNMVDIWILPRLKYPALRVPPAETRLTVYRRLSVRHGAKHSPLSFKAAHLRKILCRRQIYDFSFRP